MIDTVTLADASSLTWHDGDTVKGKWIAFERTGVSESGKTELWLVRSDGPAGRAIAEVRWYAPWRRYAFVPGRCTVYEAVCLQQITAFILALTEAHKAQRKGVAA